MRSCSTSGGSLFIDSADRLVYSNYSSVAPFTGAGVDFIF